MRAGSVVAAFGGAVLGLSTACSSGNARDAADRYDALRSCLTEVGLKAAPETTSHVGSERRLLLMLSDDALVNATIFETEDAAREEAATFQKNRAAYLRRAKDAGIEAPSSPWLRADRVFARYSAKQRVRPDIVRCLRG